MADVFSRMGWGQVSESGGLENLSCSEDRNVLLDMLEHKLSLFLSVEAV